MCRSPGRLRTEPPRWDDLACSASRRKVTRRSQVKCTILEIGLVLTRFSIRISLLMFGCLRFMRSMVCFSIVYKKPTGGVYYHFQTQTNAANHTLMAYTCWVGLYFAFTIFEKFPSPSSSSTSKSVGLGRMGMPVFSITIPSRLLRCFESPHSLNPTVRYIRASLNFSNWI